MLKPSLIILVAFGFQNVFGAKKTLCDLENSDCLTKAARKSYGDTVSGGNGRTPSSDPLFAAVIDGKLPKLSYTMYNTTFSGLSKCNVDVVRFHEGEKSYDYDLICPHINIEGKYELKGYIDTYFVEGKGDFFCDSYDYAFRFANEYELYPDQDEKLHINIKNHVVSLGAYGKVVFDFRNLYNGDKEKSAALLNYVNENWEVVDPQVRDPILKHFMALFINNINDHLKVVPMEDIFPQE